MKTDFSLFKGSLVEKLKQASQAHKDAAIASVQTMFAESVGHVMSKPETRKAEFYQHSQAGITLLEVVDLLVATD